MRFLINNNKNEESKTKTIVITGRKKNVFVLFFLKKKIKLISENLNENIICHLNELFKIDDDFVYFFLTKNN